MPILTLITFLPLLGAILILFAPKGKDNLVRWTSAVVTFLTMVLGFYVFFTFNRNTADLQFVERAAWIPSFGISYFMGLDGLSMAMLVLTPFLSFLAAVYSFNIKERVKEYFFFFLLLEAGMIGVFVALDFFLFYIFWELTLVPMYFLIGIWGGPRKEYAAIKFFLYTLFGSVVMLLGILALYLTSPITAANPTHTFDIIELSKSHGLMPGWHQYLVYAALFLGFAVKVPIFPFHTWLPDAHVEAPTAVSVILAGVLLKMGTYGLLRISYTILPEAAKYFAIPLLILAFINIVYGAFVAMAQKDLKKMIAYSSVNHMGYCLLGIAAMSTVGLNGAILQMVTHGIITGALFFLVGVIYDRAHTRDIEGFGGLMNKMPVYSAIMILTCLGSLGLPGLAGFVSEFMCFSGAFSSTINTNVFRIFTGLSIAGLVITAAYFLIMIQKVFMGPLNPKWKDLPDMTAREYVSIVPLIVLMVLLGILPVIASGISVKSVDALVMLLGVKI
ncbi:MAG: oxidoreductase [Candidatus Firestonebacteria bacterium RIFOXYA2_FULL_40_8]|nr:MAG: oxidoreductase [Candidatus Firestonebacteria bacterium RIFOXYA2_FULL_40_8]